MTVPIPSLHRADLIAFWKQNAGNFNFTFQLDLLRQISYRPLRRRRRPGIAPDHPNFTGSNPGFNYLWDGVTAGAGRWDVNNQGGGFPDSVWVDLGFPGRPHGRRPGLQAAVRHPLPGPGRAVEHQRPRLPGTDRRRRQNGSGPAGQGYGPAKVNLSKALGGSFQAVLQGNGSVLGRYGEIPGGGLPGVTNSTDKDPYGFPVSSRLNWNRWFSYNLNYWDYVNNGSSKGRRRRLGIAALLHGSRDRGAGRHRPPGLDTGRGSLTPLQNTPYDIDLSYYAAHATQLFPCRNTLYSPPNTPNCAFAVSECEPAFFRPFDRDAGTLARRLVQLAGGARV